MHSPQINPSTSSNPPFPPASRWRPALAEVFFAPVAQPDPQHLRHLLPFLCGQGPVECQRLLPLAAAGRVVVGVPITPGHADAPTGFLHQGGAGGGWRVSCSRARWTRNMGAPCAVIPAYESDIDARPPCRTGRSPHCRSRRR